MCLGQLCLLKRCSFLLIHSSYVYIRSIKRYYFVLKYAAIPVQLEIYILQYISWYYYYYYLHSPVHWLVLLLSSSSSSSFSSTLAGIIIIIIIIIGGGGGNSVRKFQIEIT